MSESTQTPHFHPLQLQRPESRPQRPVVASVPAPMRVIPGSQRTVSGSHKNTIEVCDMETGEEWVINEGHNETINSVAFFLDGRFTVSGSYDGKLRVRDMKTRKQRRILEGHNESVNSIAFTPDGRFAVSASEDKTLRVWDMKKGKVIVVFRSDGPILTCAVSPDGMTVVAGGKSGRVHFLRLEGEQ
ncbi:MAG: WD40 repeat domain-containing protein [ANME-2 cluster archaeon]|nr:MAG: WD40 repeat domain-containing protein [ANME-2 cluster archaeon]